MSLHSISFLKCNLHLYPRVMPFVILPGAVKDAASESEGSASKSQPSDVKHPNGKVPPALFVFL